MINHIKCCTDIIENQKIDLRPIDSRADLRKFRCHYMELTGCVHLRVLLHLGNLKRQTGRQGTF